MRRTLARFVRRFQTLVVDVGYWRAPRYLSELRKYWVKLRNPHVTLVFGRSVYLGPGFSLHAPFGGTFIAHDGVEFRRHFRAELGAPDARIEIGEGTRLTYSVVLQCTTQITIGRGSTLAQATLVVDGSHRFRDLSVPLLEQGYDYVPITIGDDVHIASKCTIIADVGDRAVVAANAVVTRPVPAYCVAAGVPARVIDYFGPRGSAPAGWSPENSDRSG
jgi:acetyltransferase-like isoleucine patch superfamily enzyme